MTSLTQAPDRNTQAVWATGIASFIIAKVAMVACAAWPVVCPFITPDITAALVAVLTGLVSHFVPQSAADILKLVASVQISAPDSPRPN